MNTSDVQKAMQNKTIAYKMAENPLNNSKIFERIIDFCVPSFNDLQNFRQVNRLWRDTTLDQWRSTAVLKLVTDDETPKLTITSPTSLPPTGRTGIQMGSFLDIIMDPNNPYNLRGKPFHKIKLYGMNIEDEMSTSIIKYTGNPLPLIWHKIEKCVKYLHLEDCLIENTFKIGAFHQLVLEKIPLLEKLVMTNITVLKPMLDRHPTVLRKEIKQNLTSLEIYGDIPLSLIVLLKHFPGVEDLTFGPGAKKMGHFRHSYTSTWTAITCIRQLDMDNYNIKRLDIMDTDMFKIMLRPAIEFRRTQFPLEFLSVQMSPALIIHATPFSSSDLGVKNGSAAGLTTNKRITPDNKYLIASLLIEHWSTLKIFKVFRAPFSGPIETFPFGLQLVNIRELFMWGNVAGSLSFLLNTPRLEVLYINTTCYDKWEELEEYPTLTAPFHYQPFTGDIVKPTYFLYDFTPRMWHLRDVHIELQLEPGSIETLAEWMPNLKAFRSVLNNETFRSVCETMLGLEELGVLFGSNVDNEGLTGLSAYAPLYVNNITSLKQLKKFQLDSFCGESKLTDTAVHLGFAMVPTLQRVQICVSKLMSDKAEHKLKDYVTGQVIFIRNYGKQPHLGYDCCNRKLFSRAGPARFSQI